MKKKIIISAIAVLLIVAVVFGVIFGVSCYKKKITKDYANVVSNYCETVKISNNQLMEIADMYSAYSGAFPFEEAQKDLQEKLVSQKTASDEVEKSYKALLDKKVKNDEMQILLDLSKKHYEAYKIFENNVLNKTEENYNEEYNRLYKDWQRPFADLHKQLKNIVSKY